MELHQLINTFFIASTFVEVVIMFRLMLVYLIPVSFRPIFTYWSLYLIYILVRRCIYFNEPFVSYSGQIQTLLFIIMTFNFYMLTKKHSVKRTV